MKIEDELLVRFIVMGAEEASSSHPKRTPLLGLWGVGHHKD